MRNMVNQCFTEVIDVIQAHGGDVLKFAGDAIFAVWRVKSGEGVVSQDYFPDSESSLLEEQILRAVQCGRAVQARVDLFGDAKLRLKITVRRLARV
jgi:class 3 adenylate cyclase